MENIQIVPLGGIQEYGKNLFLIEQNDEIIVFDCGFSFSDRESFGVTRILPDLSYLIDNRSKVKGIFLSNFKHENSGAIQVLLKDVNAPVFASYSTASLYNKLYNIKARALTSIFKTKHFTIEGIATTSAYLGTMSFLITVNKKKILYMNDFSLDPNLETAFKTDFQEKLSKITNGKVDFLLINSRFGHINEKITSNVNLMYTSIDEYVYKHTASNKIFVVIDEEDTLALYQAIKVASKYNRKFVIDSKKARLLFDILKGDRDIRLPKITTLAKEDIKPEDRVIYIVAEEKIHKFDKLKFLLEKKKSVSKEDGILICSSTSIVFEKDFVVTLDTFFEKNRNVSIVNPKELTLHAPTGLEIRLLVDSLSIDYIVPFNCEYREMAKLSRLLLSKTETILLSPGQALRLREPKGYTVAKFLKLQKLNYGNGISGEVSKEVLYDRRIFSNAGLFTCSIMFNKRTRKIVGLPNISMKGYVVNEEYTITEEKCIKFIINFIEKKKNLDKYNFDKLKIDLRDSLRNYLHEINKFVPLILIVQTNV